jgi:hypothetical protein
MMTVLTVWISGSKTCRSACVGRSMAYRGWSRGTVAEKGAYHCPVWERIEVFAKRNEN